MRYFLILLIIIIPGFSSARGAMHHGQGRGPHFIIRHIDKIAEALKLSKVQKDKITKLAKDFKVKELEIQKKNELLKLDLRKLLLEKTIDLKKVRSQLVKISMQHVDRRMLGIEFRVNIEKILTEDQKLKLKMFHKMRKHRNRNMRGPGNREDIL